MALKIDNKSARRLWLHSHGLGATPTGPLNVLQIIRDLGFVQLDTIRYVARAQHHIIWSRNQNYREPMLGELLASKGKVFEHFTHDASILPVEFYPMWRRQFTRMQATYDRSGYFKDMPDKAGREKIKSRIKAEGPLSTQAFDTKAKRKKNVWSRPPHKMALDYMWYAGELATSHRENFKKFYDLSERVLPPDVLHNAKSDEEQIDWLCKAALDRLSFATPGEIKRFWDAVDSDEVKNWIEQNKTMLVPVSIQAKNGSWSDALAPANIEQRLADLTPPTSRLRILNPFDPAIRDRSRIARLFGFEYRIEIFVPAARRKWGYYVCPMLEGDRFVGRIEVKANRKNACLEVINIWHEMGVAWGPQRWRKLDAELNRLGKLIGANTTHWICDIKRP